MRGIKGYLGLCAVWVGAACAQPVQTQGTPDGPQLDSAVVGATQARVVVYRPVQSSTSSLWTVHVQSRPHAALMAGTYSSECVPPGVTQVFASAAAPASSQADLRLQLEAGHTHYWRLSAAGEQAVLTVVPEAQARQELRPLQLQRTSVSRVAIPCQEDASPLELQAVAHALLPIGGLWLGDGVALTEAGATHLEALVAQWRREFVRVDRVRVVGHVRDPLAEPERAAAQQRVQLVQQALATQGGRQWRYQTEVQPLSVSALSGCSGMSAATLSQDCPLAPRTVALEVLGVRR